MLETLILLLLLASFGYTTGVLKHLGDRIDILFGLLSRIQDNEITHLQKSIDKLNKTRCAESRKLGEPPMPN